MRSDAANTVNEAIKLIETVSHVTCKDNVGKLSEIAFGESNLSVSGTIICNGKATDIVDFVVANQRAVIKLCEDCNGTGYSGGVKPKEVDLDSACEVCSGKGVVPNDLTDNAIAIGEHAFRAGFNAGIAFCHEEGFYAGGTSEEAFKVGEEKAWSEYQPSEDIKALS